jgi:S-adenosylmethionine:tRNA ribosyltransferase-isomerase
MNSPVAENLRLSDYDYDLPEALIAQEPALERDQSRLMVLGRASGSIEHRFFSNIEQHLVPGDVLVLNDTKVFPCRLPAKKRSGGKAEIFLLNEHGVNLWQALVKGGPPPGRRLSLGNGIEGEIVSTGSDGTRMVRFSGVPDIRPFLPQIGRTPLPPYIKRDAGMRDQERYQTVYADQEGAVAAPTAGLHFTPALLERIAAKGVHVAKVTLHVGPGTFQPVKTDLITDHTMMPERYSISDETAACINSARTESRRVIAVGTTSVRTIETASLEDGTVAAGAGSTVLFIYPGYRFKITDGLVTNFHLPKSTLLMLISAFAGRDRVLAAYRAAVAEQYRFYSYGDAMLIA